MECNRPILRGKAAGEPFLPFLRQNETITLRYISYDPNALCCANGSPRWPRLKSGNIALFPLKPASEPNSWNLIAEEGDNITLPATANEWRTPAVPDSPLVFILHELANALARGTWAEQNQAAVYLAGQREEPPELRSTLESLPGENDDQWLQAATALLRFTGIPPTWTVTDLMANHIPTGLRNNSIPAIASWALIKGATRDYPNRLISALIARGLYDPLKEFRVAGSRFRNDSGPASKGSGINAACDEFHPLRQNDFPWRGTEGRI